MEATIKKGTTGEFEPYGTRGCYGNGKSVRFAVLLDGAYSGYSYPTKKKAQAVADFANESGYAGVGCLEMKFEKHQAAQAAK